MDKGVYKEKLENNNSKLRTDESEYFNEENNRAISKEWLQVHMSYLGQQLKQHEKYTIIDQAFKGQKYMLPQINEPNNEALILGLQRAGVRIGPNGLPKNKTY